VDITVFLVVIVPPASGGDPNLAVAKTVQKNARITGDSAAFQGGWLFRERRELPSFGVCVVDGEERRLGVWQGVFESVSAPVKRLDEARFRRAGKVTDKKLHYLMKSSVHLPDLDNTQSGTL